MVSKLEMQDCIDAATKLIVGQSEKMPMTEANTKQLVQMITFLFGGVLECVFDIRDSLQTIAQTQSHLAAQVPITAPLQANPFEPGATLSRLNPDGSAKK